MAADKKSRWYQDLSAVRWIFAIFGILIMLFTGGCSLLIFADYLQHGGGGYVDIPIILFVGGIPFLVGLLVWFLAAKVGRRQKEAIENSDE